VGGKLTREFIYESVTQPQAYTYMDYTYSPPKFFPARMPVINKPPIDLDNNELLSVISFIQSQGGEVTIDPSEIVLGDSVAALGRAGDPAAGQKQFAKMNCAKCHSADLLQAKLMNKDEGMIRLAILDPNAGIKTDPKPVHKGFDQALSVRDFNDLTAYLAGLKTATAAP
jgi:cytochrome c553